MTKDFLKKSINLFDTYEKWNAFLELRDINESIKMQWKSDFLYILKNKFTSEKVGDWLYRQQGKYWGIWYLAPKDENTIQFLIYDDWFCFWVDNSIFDLNEVKYKLEQDRFTPLKELFTPETSETDSDNSIIRQKGIYVFDEIQTNYIDFERICWFAGKKPKELLDQIICKVDGFRKNPLIKELVLEIEKDCRKTNL